MPELDNLGPQLVSSPERRLGRLLAKAFDRCVEGLFQDIAGVDDIKHYLMDRPAQFTRCLTEKMLVYALGRELSFVDRDDIDRISQAMPPQQYGLRELIQQIVASEAFQTK